jgi:2-keto-4-pentenoate hydratase/2-oxohepta-3-ene-1,7-dioic acid hydratase in catechol pathway
MKRLSLKLVGKEGTSPLRFTIRRMINAGYVGRNRSAVMAHIEELRREGIPPPPSVPLVFPVMSHNITTSNRIEVVSSKTSGEAEYVLLIGGGKIYVGVGSDHTDRELEKASIVQSKQVCQNIVSSAVWDYGDVQSTWDDFILRSWVKEEGSEGEVLYQSAALSSIIHPEELMKFVQSRVTGGIGEGTVIFSGTVPVVADRMIYGGHFRCELTSPRSGRSLGCGYQVHVLDYVRDGKLP